MSITNNQLHWFKEDHKYSPSNGEYYALERYPDFTKIIGYVDYPSEHTKPNARVYFGLMGRIQQFSTVEECKKYVEDQYQLYILSKL